MDTAQFVATIMGAGGGGAVLLVLVNGLIKWLSGAAGRERQNNTSLEKQRRDAVRDRELADTRADISDKHKRDAYEYASVLRRLLREAGVEPPDWPETANPAASNDDNKEKK